MPDRAQNLFKLIGPVDAEGIRLDRPGSQVLWKKLTNVAFDRGFLRTRPGLQPVGPNQQDLTDPPRPITALSETVQWQNENFPSCEYLVPDATVSSTDWTGTHADVDETTPDNGVTSALSTTDDAQLHLTFANPSTAYNVIDSVTLYVRARSTGGRAQINLLMNGAIETIDLGNEEFTDTGEATSENFMDFFIPLPFSNPTTKAPWTDTNIDSAFMVYEVQLPSSSAIALLGATTTGNDNDFAGTAGDWERSEGRDHPIAWFADYETVNEGTTGDRLSLTFAGWDNARFTSISNVSARFAVGKTTPINAVVQLYHRGTDTVRRNIGSQITITERMPESGGDWRDPNYGIQLAIADATTNPETGAAWSSTLFNSTTEFGIEVISGDIAFSTAELVVTGAATNAGVEIDTTGIIVCGRTFDSPNDSDSVEQFHGRIMATSGGFQRLVTETPIGGNALEDVLGAVANPVGGPWPMGTATYFNRIYYINGIDLPYYYEGVTMAKLSAGTPIGQTIWTFGDRLMQGDVLDAGTRSIKRIAYSGIAAPDDWTADDAGDFDLIQGGEGRVRKGLALSSTTSAVYMDKGIYLIRSTGDDDAPFIPRIVDSDTGIVAPASCVAVADSAGQAVHMFLGNGPQGLNVYAFDGNNVQPVGGEIQRDLEGLSTPHARQYAFGAVEPEGNYYLLFIAENDNVLPRMAWAYSLDSGEWVRWEFPFYVTAAGHWTLFGLRTNGAASHPTGTKRLVLGTSHGVPFRLNYNRSSDMLAQVTDNNNAGTSNDYGYDTPTEGRTGVEEPIAFDIQTGDFTLGSNDIVQNTAIKRIWITYEDVGKAEFELSVSIDGGETFLTGVEDVLGTGGSFDFDLEDNVAASNVHRLREKVVDVPNPTAARHHSIRIRAIPNDDEVEEVERGRQEFRLAKIMVEYEELGEMP